MECRIKAFWDHHQELAKNVNLMLKPVSIIDVIKLDFNGGSDASTFHRHNKQCSDRWLNVSALDKYILKWL